MSTPDKATILVLLDRWIRQRPGLEYGNYGEPTSYRAEVRSIGKDLAHARQLLRAVELSGITGEELAAAFPRAYSGRLTLEQRYRVNGKGKTFPTLELAQARANEFLPAIVAIEPVWALNYCTGQYWPTEYRRAACAVLAAALWAYKREKCMPEPNGKINHYTDAGELVSEHDSIQGKTPGDWLRSSFRREFGRGIANRWFD